MATANEEARGDLVLLQTCGDNQEASLIKTRLEAEGILCVIQGENHRSMLGVMGPYIELRVLVPESDLERARTLITVPPDELEQEAAASISSESMLPLPEATGEDPRPARRRRYVMIYFAVAFVLPWLLILIFGR